MTSLSNKFTRNTLITSFEEWQYFTGITAVGENYFQVCSNLKFLTPPPTLTSLATYAIYQTSSLDHIVFPSSVTNLRNGVAQAPRLRWVIVLATNPPSVNSGAFGSTGNCKIYVPDESLTSYKSSWTNHTSRLKSLKDFPTDFPDDAEELGLV